MEEMDRELREENRRVVDAMVQELRTFIAETVNNRNNEEDGSNQEGPRRDRVADRREDRMRHLEVPYFSGEDPYDWIYRAERYFEINQIPEDEKVLAASVCFEGKALNWFQ